LSTIPSIQTRTRVRSFCLALRNREARINVSLNVRAERCSMIHREMKLTASLRVHPVDDPADIGIPSSISSKGESILQITRVQRLRSAFVRRAPRFCDRISHLACILFPYFVPLLPRQSCQTSPSRFLSHLERRGWDRSKGVASLRPAPDSSETTSLP